MRYALLVCATLALGLTPRNSALAQAPLRESALPAWALDSVGRLAAGQDVIRGISLNMTHQQVLAHLGTPDSVVKGYDPSIDSTATLYYASLTILLSPHGVEELTCARTACRLPNRIGVGSTLGQVVQLLGRGHPGYGPGLSRSLFYYPEGCDCWLEIRFNRRQRVVALSLTNDNS